MLLIMASPALATMPPVVEHEAAATHTTLPNYQKVLETCLVMGVAEGQSQESQAKLSTHVKVAHQDYLVHCEGASLVSAQHVPALA